jgi:hypothetical protein
MLVGFGYAVSARASLQRMPFSLRIATRNPVNLPGQSTMQ